MRQWTLLLLRGRALVPEAAMAAMREGAVAGPALVRRAGQRRGLSASSVPDRRKRNHLPSNKKDHTRRKGEGADARAGGGSDGRRVENRDLFGSSARQGNSSNNSQQQQGNAFRQSLKKKNRSLNKQEQQQPVFTNKFQNLLSFAFEEDGEAKEGDEHADGGGAKANGGASSGSRAPRHADSTGKKKPLRQHHHKPAPKDDDGDDDLFADDGADGLALTQLGLDADFDDGSAGEDQPWHAKKFKHRKAPRPKLFSADSDPASVLSALGISSGGSDGSGESSDASSGGGRKALKGKKKKDGRSLLKNFKFEHSLFDDDSDLFGHIDWEEKGDEDTREQRRFQRRLRKETKQKPKTMLPPQEVEVPTSISVKDLAERMCIKSKLLLKELKDLGERGLHEDSVLSNDIAEVVVESLNMIPVLLPPEFVDLELTVPPEDCSMFPTRPPIVSVMGHVDHGKTTLLDALRKSKVAASEAGGITQGIGAFSVNLGKNVGGENTPKTMTFIDTPGHAAFSNMRSRGSEVTDLIVLVVAADDGVRPQTVEVIQLALKNNVPLVVAVTKCDMHSHDQDEVVKRIGDQLLNQGVVVEHMSGDTPLVCVSGKTGEGLDTLKETIALHAEVMDLRADPKPRGEAVVLEANVARGVGTQVDAIVKWGTLTNGSIVVCGLEYGKVRALVDDAGKRVKLVKPGNPVRVIGLKGLPEAGDALLAVESEEKAKEVIEQRREIIEWDLMATVEEEEQASTGTAVPHRRRKLARTRRKWEEQELRRRQEADEAKRLASLKAGDEGYIANVVPIIVKTDTVGVISAIDELIASLPSDEAVIKRIMAAVGPVTSSDLAMAEATGATVYCFNVKHQASIDREALEKNVSLRQHRVIYSLLDDVKQLLLENLSGVEETEVIGAAEVVQAIPITSSGRRTKNIAGCKVTMGSMNMQAKYRIVRDGETVVADVAMESMRHFQQKVAEVTKGQECGLQLGDFDAFQPGDVLEAYVVKVVKQTL